VKPRPRRVNQFADGRYQISPMAAGTYTVIFEKTGYQTLQITGVEIEVGTIKTLNTSVTPAP